MVRWTQIGWGLAILLAVLATVAEVRTKRIPNGLVYPFIVAALALTIGSYVYWYGEGVVGASAFATCLGESLTVVVGFGSPG